MTNFKLEQLKKFRKDLFIFLKYRSDSILELIDANAAQVYKESVVELSMNNAFRRSYSSITDALDNFFRTEAGKNPTKEGTKATETALTSLISNYCEIPKTRLYETFVLDSTGTPRVYAPKLTDRKYVYLPTHVPGQKPFTIGHQYSVLAYLPETESGNWLFPLSTMRVASTETGAEVGVEQVQNVLKTNRFKNNLCVFIGDCGYSQAKFVRVVKENSRVMVISRMRLNRTLRKQSAVLVGKRGRGRTKIYGEKWSLSDPGPAAEEIFVKFPGQKGQIYYAKISRWRNLLMPHSEKICATNGRIKLDKQESKEKSDYGTEDKEKWKYQVDPLPVDVVKVTLTTAEGSSIFKKPLLLLLAGKQKEKFPTEEIFPNYRKRYDIEHYFRFGKQRLLLNKSQTPDTRHEENWMKMSMLSYLMLCMSRNCGEQILRPWERKKESSPLKTPTQAQRSYAGIIKEIGTPARKPKPRGKSPGRAKGSYFPQRIDHPVVKKGKKRERAPCLSAA